MDALSLRNEVAAACEGMDAGLDDLIHGWVATNFRENLIAWRLSILPTRHAPTPSHAWVYLSGIVPDVADGEELFEHINVPAGRSRRS